jgi:pimeloyl-ACP methyl ester carboxylesterase
VPVFKIDGESKRHADSGHRMVIAPEFNFRYPVLLVHGLFSSSRTWRKTVKSFQDDYDLKYGGEISAQSTAAIRAADFYTWNFSSNHRLSYREQAGELAQGINQVLVANQCSKIVLAGHSMGGLAARAFIQFVAAEQVHALITLGTPHYGSPLALLRQSTQARAQKLLRKLHRALARADDDHEKRPGLFKRMIIWLFRITTEAEAEVDDFFDSAAFLELAPDSAALEELNRAPLPESVRYAFITGSLTDFNAFREGEIDSRYQKLKALWLKASIGTVGSLNTRYLTEANDKFRNYLTQYVAEISGFSTAQLMDSDGAVPVLSQAIRHFKIAPALAYVLPVYASHNRLTKRPAKLFQALAACGVIGARENKSVPLE